MSRWTRSLAIASTLLFACGDDPPVVVEGALLWQGHAELVLEPSGSGAEAEWVATVDIPRIAIDRTRDATAVRVPALSMVVVFPEGLEEPLHLVSKPNENGVLDTSVVLEVKAFGDKFIYGVNSAGESSGSQVSLSRALDREDLVTKVIVRVRSKDVAPPLTVSAPITISIAEEACVQYLERQAVLERGVKRGFTYEPEDPDYRCR